MRRSRIAAAKGRKRYWREADARAVLAEFEARKLSMAEFCHETGLKRRRVERWRKLLRSQDDKPAERPETMELVPVRVVQRGDGEADGGSIEVVLHNGRRLAVERGFDRALLAEVAAAVESWPC